MIVTNSRIALVILLGAGAWMIGFGPCTHRALPAADADQAAKDELSELEERLSRTLREQGSWKEPKGGYTLFAEKVEGRRLFNLRVRIHREIEVKCYAHEGEFRVDTKNNQILLHTHRCFITSQVLDSYVENKVWPLSFEVPPLSELEQRLHDGFGANSEALKQPMTLLLRDRRLVMAAGSFHVEPDGRVRLAPCWLVRVGPIPEGGKAPALTAVRCDAAYIRCDRPLATLSEMGSRKLVDIETSGGLRLSLQP
jgi:hypothetical protein